MDTYLKYGQKNQIKLQSANTALEVNKLEGEQIRTSEAIDSNKSQIKDLNYRIKMMKKGYLFDNNGVPTMANEMGEEERKTQLKEAQKQKKITTKVTKNLEDQYNIRTGQIGVMKQILEDVGGQR